ncbi:S-methyl-5-thioribose-1-phosphate isomerase [Acuticoccus sediminis]|uniref:Methylthioribose-1-phosphate isomerase n=1 Tax=Acuticoccus sediminis TaxID=2184697 RepID=A0A8B2NUD0_9HYPH|nr:S-methyl-5-thioribose-1-phosphate isomerase [Acuticoccus sediminis]RAH99939.1 S-methyl-5-thioribose-1-phosphate isomerase [Acuticoccus sediminis]
MKTSADGSARRTIWATGDGAVEIIDQTRLPHEYATKRLASVEDVAEAIAVMRVRGAPLIGATAAYGMAIAADVDPSDAALALARQILFATRPTAVNLGWALARVADVLASLPLERRAEAAWTEAEAIAAEDIALNGAIGDHGLALIKAAQKARPGETVNVLTHCNAGWLATVGWGTATAPIYKAHAAGIPIHVWVDETRPRNQGASLTAWELAEAGVPHTLIADNAGGHLMQHGRVDLCIVGTDRTAANGDVCNKIGTYLKALAAHDNGVPFYVALPSPTLDLSLQSGRDVPIEERAGTEVTEITGRTADGRIESVCVTTPSTAAANPAFDVTPARLVTGLVTERGVIEPERLREVFGSRA